MSKKKYNKQLKEGNTNMDYDTWKLMNKITKLYFNTTTIIGDWYKNE